MGVGVGGIEGVERETGEVGGGWRGGEGEAAIWGGGAIEAGYVNAFLAAALTRVMRAAVPIHHNTENSWLHCIRRKSRHNSRRRCIRMFQPGTQRCQPRKQLLRGQTAPPTVRVSSGLLPTRCTSDRTSLI